MAVGLGMRSYDLGDSTVSVGDLNTPRELGLIERSIGVVTGLQSLHAKLGQLRDKIEGNGSICSKETALTPVGLPGQLSESESVLRACHSLLDDIAGKF